MQEIISHCENDALPLRRDRQRQGRCNAADLDPRDHAPADTSTPRFYYPWIVISDPQTGARKLVPPGGHVLGIYARTDTERGVFKAPANEIVRGALDLEYRHQRRRRRTMLNPQRRQRHPPLPRARHPRLGRAHAVVERAVEIRQRPPAVHLPRALDLRRHAVGRVRAERRPAVGARQGHDPAVPAHAVARTARCSAAPRRRRSSSPATARR